MQLILLGTKKRNISSDFNGKQSQFWFTGNN